METEMLEIFQIANGFIPNEREENLFTRASEISNSELPLIEFLNDIFRRKFDKQFSYDMALNDFEKVLDYIIHLQYVEDKMLEETY